MAAALRYGPLGPRTIHLCIDMQVMFGPHGLWSTPWMPRVLPIVVEVAERHASSTIFTRFITPRRAEDMPGAWRRFYAKWEAATLEHLDAEALRLMPELRAFVPPAEIVNRTLYSAFAGGQLDRRLAERRADTLVITGAESEVCVLATVLGAVDRGYRVVLATDALCSSSDAGHDAIVSIYNHRFGHQIEAASADEILTAWNHR